MNKFKKAVLGTLAGGMVWMSGCALVDALNDAFGRNETTIGMIVDDAFQDLLDKFDDD